MAKEINAGLQIVYRKLSEMHPNLKNPRKSTKEAIERLAASIQGNPNFFEARPILLSDRTGKLVIIGGERRWEAAQYLEMETAPSILFHGLTEEQEDEIMVRDNTHAGIWVDSKLQELAKIWGNEIVSGWMPSESWRLDDASKSKNPVNSELDVNGFDDKIKLTLEFTIEQHAFIQKALQSKGKTKEEVLLKLLGYGAE